MSNRFRKRLSAQEVILEFGVLREKFTANDKIKGNPDIKSETNLFPYKKIEKCWDQLHPGPPYLSGGPFTKYKLDKTSDGVLGQGVYTTKPSLRGSTYREYTGGFGNPLFNGDSVNKYLTFNTGLGSNGWLPNLSSFETKAYKLLKPKLERANLAVSLAELRDLPRMLKTSLDPFKDQWNRWKSDNGYRRNFNPAAMPRKASDHFLNHVFGWSPFVSDLLKMVEITIFSEQYMHDAIAANNTWMKRRSLVEHTKSVQTINWGSGVGASPSLGFFLDNMCDSYTFRGSTVFNHWEQLEELSTQVWAEGWFKYYRPELDASLADHMSLMSKAKRYALLYGLRINPVVVWKVTPWSWLSDWFVNLGDAIEHHWDIYNDSIVSKDVYLMCHSERHRRQISSINFWTGRVNMEWYRLVDIKQRKRGDNPFSFTLGGDLTASQYAILAALGISRWT